MCLSSLIPRSSCARLLLQALLRKRDDDLDVTGCRADLQLAGQPAVLADRCGYIGEHVLLDLRPRRKLPDALVKVDVTGSVRVEASTAPDDPSNPVHPRQAHHRLVRSEERRVGKEVRS